MGEQESKQEAPDDNPTPKSCNMHIARNVFFEIPIVE